MSPMLERINAEDKVEVMALALQLAERTIRAASLGACPEQTLRGIADDIKAVLVKVGK